VNKLVEIHRDVQELLDELNLIGKSVIFGGYLRDRYFGNMPNDVDIATNIPIDVLEDMYCHAEKAKRRVTTSGHDVFSFKMHRTEKIFVEIVSIKSNVLDKSKQADYTINSLLYDGKQIIDTVGAFKDIDEKILREVDADVITEDLSVRPYLWLKTLRLISMTGFDLSDETYEVLNTNKSCINEISAEIMQTEGHKTLNGKNPFKAMKILAKMGFVEDFEVSDSFREQKISIQPQQHLCLLAILSNKKTIDDYAKFYKFQQDLIDKYERLYGFMTGVEKTPSRFKNQIITINKIIKGEFKNG
jgi:tRNA nucleotidyltransferase/poly(A) polymerase